MTWVMAMWPLRRGGLPAKWVVASIPMWTLGSPHDSGDMTTRNNPTRNDRHTDHWDELLATRWGIAALVKAATYIVGFGVMGAYLAPRGLLDAQGDPGASLSFLLDNQAAMYSWYLVLCLVGGIALVSLVLGCTTYSVARLRRCR